MAYYIDEDGQTVHTYETSGTGVVLSDGRSIPEERLNNMRLFAVHPADNSLMTKDKNGVWLYQAPNGMKMSMKSR